MGDSDFADRLEALERSARVWRFATFTIAALALVAATAAWTRPLVTSSPVARETPPGSSGKAAAPSLNLAEVVTEKLVLKEKSGRMRALLSAGEESSLVSLDLFAGGRRAVSLWATDEGGRSLVLRGGTDDSPGDVVSLGLMGETRLSVRTPSRAEIVHIDSGVNGPAFRLRDLRGNDCFGVYCGNGKSFIEAVRHDGFNPIHEDGGFVGP